MNHSGNDLLNAALRAFEQRDRDEAAALLAQLETDTPALGDSWGAVARLAMVLGEVRIALSAIERHVQANPASLERQLTRGAMLASAGRVQQALETIQALGATPSPHLLLFTGTCHAQLGQNALAIDDLRTALRLAAPPAVAAAAWLALSDLKRFSANDADILAMRSAGALKSDSPSPLSYALGKALDDAGEAEASFDAYLIGAAKVRAQRPYQVGPSRAFVDQIISGFSAETLTKLSSSQIDSDRPIFVLGLPRSGTTLVEQILASHSAVAGGAELNLFRAATMALGGYGPADLAVFAARDASGQAWTRFGEAYLRLLGERFGPEGHVVDKTLNHTRFVGVIRHVLPRARFVWLRRDPRDNALSCFRSHFAQGLNWSWSLTDIAEHFLDEDRLHRHWTELYPDAILTVPYEELVTDPDTWIGKILDHCRLPFEPGVRDFHLTRRPVATTSANQVRQPLYTRSIGGWQRYAEWLAPFCDAYGVSRA